MDEERKKSNPLGILTELPGSIGFLANAFTPNRFGFSPLRLVTRDSNGLVSVVSPSGVGEINYDTGQVKILKNVGSSFIRFDTNFAEPKADAKQEVVLKVLQGTVTVNQV